MSLLIYAAPKTALICTFICAIIPNFFFFFFRVAFRRTGCWVIPRVTQVFEDELIYRQRGSKTWRQIVAEIWICLQNYGCPTDNLRSPTLGEFTGHHLLDLMLNRYIFRSLPLSVPEFRFFLFYELFGVMTEFSIFLFTHVSYSGIIYPLFRLFRFFFF